MSITILVEITIKPEHYYDYRKFMKRGTEIARSSEGCRLIEGFENEDAPGSFMFREIWSDRASHEEFVASMQESDAMKTLGPWMAGPPVVRYFNGLDV